MPCNDLSYLLSLRGILPLCPIRMASLENDSLHAVDRGAVHREIGLRGSSTEVRDDASPACISHQCFAESKGMHIHHALSLLRLLEMSHPLSSNHETLMIGC